MGANWMAEMASVGGFASSDCAGSCQYDNAEHGRHLDLTYRHFNEVLGLCEYYVGNTALCSRTKLVVRCNGCGTP